MEPEEKAKELVGKFEPHMPTHNMAIGSALICVDEIINDPHNTQRGLAEDMHLEYWSSVRQEIEKL